MIFYCSKILFQELFGITASLNKFLLSLSYTIHMSALQRLFIVIFSSYIKNEKTDHLLLNKGWKIVF